MYKFLKMSEEQFNKWNSENPENKIEMREGDDGCVITPPMPDYTKLR